MQHRLKQVVALWFVIQIVVPFTAPLQTLDLRDFFGGSAHHHSTSSPESTTTPTMREAAHASSFVSMPTSVVLGPATFVLSDRHPAQRLTTAFAFRPSSSPHIQSTVLRV
ncbi:MAG TPA: hypothetical protein VLV86_08610 [Vicinamibacterales bacterium]|nr:hypothetical protein [Vicinamibacterales bacterium]